MAGYDIWSGEIRLWWSRTKRELRRLRIFWSGRPCSPPGIASITGENGGKGVTPKKADSKAKSDGLSPSELATDKKKLMDLIDRAQDGDEGALPLLRAIFISSVPVAPHIRNARSSRVRPRR
jgi:hypothetical protein